jgi:hypothetical protein
LAERKLEQLDAGFRQSIRARDKRTNGERVSGRDFGFYFSSAKGYLTRMQDPKDAVEYTPVNYTRHAARLVGSTGPTTAHALSVSQIA